MCFCVCRTTVGHSRVLSLRKSLHLPEEQERGVCGQDGESTNTKDGVEIAMAAVWYTKQDLHDVTHSLHMPCVSASPCN